MASHSDDKNGGKTHQKPLEAAQMPKQVPMTKGIEKNIYGGKLEPQLKEEKKGK